MKRKKYTFFSIMLLLFLSAFVMLRQLKSPDYFSCIIEDSYTFTSWAWQFIEALKEGIIYPRWLPLNFWGYGSPTFILYPPLAFYLVGFFNIFVDPVVSAMNITKFIALFLSAVGMLYLVKEFYSDKIALLTAIFNIIFPYQIFQFYFVGTFASTISFMWFSPILLFTYRYFEKRKYIYLLCAGACYGGLIVTHPVNAYMFTLIIIAFAIYMSIVKKRINELISIPFIIATGLLLSAAYIFPLIYEKQFLNVKAFIGEGSGFHFANFFILPNLTSKFPQDNFWPVYYNTFASYVLFFSAFLLLSFHQILRLRHAGKKENVIIINKFFLAVAASGIFLLFGASKFFWETVPFFKYIQFPIRWLNITFFATIFLSSVIFWTLRNSCTSSRVRTLFIVSLALICLSLDYMYIYSASIFKRQELMPVKAVNWNPEHLPIWVDIKKINTSDSEDKILITEGIGKAEIKAWKSAERIIGLAVFKPLTLKVHTFNFPGWKAYIDSLKTETRTVAGEGAILVDIPSGDHTLKLKFEDTPIRYYSKFISLISFFALTFALIGQRKRSKKRFGFN